MEISSKHVTYVSLFVNIFVIFICWKLNSSRVLPLQEATSSAAGEYSVVLTTCPNIKVAKELSHKLVQVKFVACVNIIPQITSVYMWKNKVEEETEVLLVAKTKSDLIPELIRLVKESHPYEVPEIISLGIKDGNKKYLQWIGEVVKGRVQK